MRLRLTPYLIGYLLLLFVGVQIFIAVRTHGLRAVYLFPVLQRALPVDLVAALAFFMYFGLRAISYRMVARRATLDELATAQGRCFNVVLAPPHCLFARIGPTLEAAIWYLLPIEWDALVAPSEDTFEVEYLPGTGWVQRVRRFGASPRELVQPAPSEVNDAVETADEGEGLQPSAEEQRELRRYTRRVWQCWGESAASIGACGWSGVLGGIIFAPGMLVFAYWTVVTSPIPLRQSDAVAGIMLLATFFAIGCGCIIWGVWSFRLWGRVRRAAQEGAQAVEGEIVSWLPYRRGRETIVKVRADDGETKILRVRGSVNHRVRRVGDRVRIEYMPISEYVTTVSYAETPTQVS